MLGASYRSSAPSASHIAPKQPKHRDVRPPIDQFLQIPSLFAPTHSLAQILART